MFSPTVTAFWRSPLVGGDVLYQDGTLTVVSNAGLAPDRRVTVLTTVDGSLGDVGEVLVALTPDVGALLKISTDQGLTAASVRAALQDVGVTLHEADCVFHFTQSAASDLLAQTDAPGVRRLTQDDAAAFAAFEAGATEQDLDDAYVELDHWAVFGAFEGDRLVSAASMYPWGDSRLADTGVLTLPEHRGQGHARRVVQAISRYAYSQGYEPQYRCQVDNTASRSLAARTGLTQLGTWEVVSPDAKG